MTRLKFALALATVVASSAWAQNENSKLNAEYFRLDFNLKEMEGSKLISTRAYQMMVRTDETALSSIRSGARVPVPNGDKATTYIDVGVNIDVRRVNHVKDDLSVDVISEVSGAAEPVSSTTPQSGPPVIRQTRWNSIVSIPLRKPTVIFSSDDPTSKRQLQLEVTATPVR
jgi:hypothetical protein